MFHGDRNDGGATTRVYEARIPSFSVPEVVS